MRKTFAGLMSLLALIGVGLCSSGLVHAAGAPGSANASAQTEDMTKLVYGRIYHLKNGYLPSSYLDTRGGEVCQDNLVCVSTAAGMDRDSGSGSWKVLSRSGIADGQVVQAGERIALMNMYPFQGGSHAYLDTRGGGCEDNFLCVSGAWGYGRDEMSGTWIIMKKSGIGGPINLSDWVLLLNAYHGGGGYLDTKGHACQSNMYCVSTATSSDRDSGSGSWLMINKQ